MIGDILITIFNILMAVILMLLKLILMPIDYLIEQSIPSLSAAFTAVGSYITAILTNIGWVLSITGIPAIAFGLIAAYWLFKLTLPVNVWFIKLAVNWYHRLKP